MAISSAVDVMWRPAIAAGRGPIPMAGQVGALPESCRNRVACGPANAPGKRCGTLASAVDRLSSRRTDHHLHGLAPGFGRDVERRWLGAEAV
jgi:hypothetical protein